jgi:peptide/nickel transport system permease protein
MVRNVGQPDSAVRCETPAFSAGPPEARAVRRHWYAGVVRRRSILIGGALLLIVLGLAVLAPVIAPFNPNLVRPEIQFIRPNAVHLFGTDNFGRDLFSRTLYGAQNSLLVGSSVVLLSCLLGTLAGLLAGFYRRVDTVLMGIMDSLMAFPGIVLAVAIMAAIGPRLQNVILALGVVQIPRVTRLVRSVVFTIVHTQYIEAGRAIGLGDTRILLRHILPNCLSPLIVQGTFIFGLAVLGEASLSFLGVGAPPYIPSWGNILGEARVYVRDAPYMMLLPGMALSITILGLNLMGDGIRDWLDPMATARRLEAQQRAQ